MEPVDEPVTPTPVKTVGGIPRLAQTSAVSVR